ncbi:MAG TPA: hypothetical protein VN628_03060 [Vicinamibacterales bacterium]|nr:hypothetical protein [Vicinamibacterales bacterium]
MVPELDPHRVQIQRIVSSKAFKTSEVHRNLLNYLAEKSLAGEAQNLKEYTVGLDVFGKPSSYDPRQESVVRMHVGRLRQKLAEYYRTDGASDPVIVDLPKGAFALTFEARPAPEPPDGMPLPASAVPQRRGFSAREVALAVLLFAAVGAAGYFALRLSTVQKAEVAAPAPGPWTPALQELWAPLLSSERPLMVTLATGPQTAGSSVATIGNAATGVGTANAAFLLGQFLGQRKHNVFPIRSDVLSMGEIAMGDVIFVGPTVGKPQIKEIPPVDAAFTLTPEGVTNLKPEGGEPAVMVDSPKLVQNGQETEESHALISNLPGLYGNGSILYFEGNKIASVMGAVQAMTDPDLASQLVARLKRNTGSLPRYYQVVLRVKAMDETPVDISYVAHRALTISKGLKTAQNRGQ